MLFEGISLCALTLSFFLLLAWGYGFLSVTIISLASLAGVAIIPFIGKAIYKKALTMLVALAVGSLTGDSLLHLLPHVRIVKVKLIPELEISLYNLFLTVIHNIILKIQT